MPSRSADRDAVPEDPRRARLARVVLQRAAEGVGHGAGSNHEQGRSVAHEHDRPRLWIAPLLPVRRRAALGAAHDVSRPGLVAMKTLLGSRSPRRTIEPSSIQAGASENRSVDFDDFTETA